MSTVDDLTPPEGGTLEDTHAIYRVIMSKLLKEIEINYKQGYAEGWAAGYAEGRGIDNA